MSISESQLLERLEAADFAALVGEFESAWLECKRAPYRFDTEAGKLELAKDVCGLANAEGGVILLGFSTKRDETHGVDVIDAVRPIPLAQFNEEQHRSIIHAWTWPNFGGVDVNVYPDSRDATRGVVALRVRQCTAEEYPLLVCKSVLEGRTEGALFGFYERKHTAVVPEAVARLHSLISAGMRNNDILERLDGMSTLLSAVRQASPPQPPPITFRPGDIDGRATQAVAAVELEGLPSLMLLAAPLAHVNTDELFASRNAPLVQLIENPPEIRGSGFDLAAGGSSHIVRGLLRRAVVPRLKLLEMHRDGLLIFVNTGDGDGLCRARHPPRDNRLINQLVLVENTYLFALLCKEAFEGRAPGDCNIEYRFVLTNVCSQELPCALQSGPINEWRDGPTRTETDTFIQVMKTLPLASDPARVAYLILSDIYTRFGFETDSIPYTREEPGLGVVIDSSAIQAAGRRDR